MEKILVYLKGNYKSLIKRLLILSTFLITVTGYNILNNYRGKVYHIPLGLDNLIPFNKYFIVPYVLWYFYVGFFFTFYGFTDEKRYIKLIMGINVGMLISYVIFYFFPTTVPRPTLYGNDIFTRGVMAIYNNDNPYNCFPSIHVLNSVVVAIYVQLDSRFNKIVKICSGLIAFSIILSTLYIKQHYVYDAISGTAIAILVYVGFNYRDTVEWFNARFKVPADKPLEVSGE